MNNVVALFKLIKRVEALSLFKSAPAFSFFGRNGVSAIGKDIKFFVRIAEAARERTGQNRNSATRKFGRLERKIKCRNILVFEILSKVFCSLFRSSHYYNRRVLLNKRRQIVQEYVELSIPYGKC